MRFLKFLVITMGILIIAGIAFLIYGISTGLHRKKPIQISSPALIQAVPESQQLPQIDKIPTFGDHTLVLDDKQTVQGYQIVGRRLIIHIQTKDAPQERRDQWIIWDIETGAQLGTIRTDRLKNLH